MGRPKKKYTDRELTEGSNVWCIVYPDSDIYDSKLIINRLDCYWDEYFWIFHDRDVYTELNYDKFKAMTGEEPPFKIGDHKKAHYHLIGHVNSPTLLSRASVKFGVPSNDVQKLDSLRDAVIYLTHRNDSQKTQYDQSEIITNASDKVEKFMKSVSDITVKAILLTDFIASDDCDSFSTLAQFAIKNNCWDELRRGQHIYTTIFMEKRNNQYESKSNRN